MAYINLDNELPGIRGLMRYRPETARPLNELAEVLLRDDNNSLSRGERELIATYVSYLNDCFFCQNVHGALAGHYLGCSMAEIDSIKASGIHTTVTPKMRALLAIAAQVQQSGKAVTQSHIDAARKEGASDRELHDTVLIAAAFCMYNRYVDGLASFTPTDEKEYEAMGKRMAEKGYVMPQQN